MALFAVLECIIQKLTQQPNILAVLCYGSYAEGTQDEKSDIDLLVICKDNIIDERQRRNIYELCSAKEIKLLKSHDHWETTWTPVNDEFVLNNQKVEVGYNVSSWVNTVVTDIMQQGSTSLSYFQFRPYTFLGLLENALCLYEKENYFTALKQSIRPYPAKLKENIIQENLGILNESLADLEDCAARNIGFLAFQFFLFRALDAAIQILFAINEVYYPASKREEKHLLRLPLLPPGFQQFIVDTLPDFYNKKENVLVFLKQLQAYIHSHH